MSHLNKSRPINKNYCYCERRNKQQKKIILSDWTWS